MFPLYIDCTAFGESYIQEKEIRFIKICTLATYFRVYNREVVALDVEGFVTFLIYTSSCKSVWCEGDLPRLILQKNLNLLLTINVLHCSSIFIEFVA